MGEAQSVRTTISLPESMHDLLSKIADQEAMTLNELIVHLLNLGVLILHYDKDGFQLMMEKGDERVMLVSPAMNVHRHTAEHISAE